jgi:hypothetical protein
MCTKGGLARLLALLEQYSHDEIVALRGRAPCDSLLSAYYLSTLKP